MANAHSGALRPRRRRLRPSPQGRPPGPMPKVDRHQDGRPACVDASRHSRQHATAPNSAAQARICRMSTDAVFRRDAYLRFCDAVVTHVSDDGVELDRTVFYPLGGGHAGDSGTAVMADGTRWRVLDARKSRREGATPDDTVHLLDPASGWQRQLAPGTPLRAEIDWERRYRHMRFHTATHLLCAVVRQ